MRTLFLFFAFLSFCESDEGFSLSLLLGVQWSHAQDFYHVSLIEPLRGPPADACRGPISVGLTSFKASP